MTPEAIRLLGARKWITLAEACIYTGRSRKTILRYIEAGGIKASRPGGGHWQIDRESIDAFFTPAVSKKAVDILRSLRK